MRFYYLCNLKHPFNNNEENIKYPNYKPVNSRYSNELRSLINWCLEIDKNRRPTITKLFQEEFIVFNFWISKMCLPYSENFEWYHTFNKYNLDSTQRKIETYKTNFKLLYLERNGNSDELTRFHRELLEPLYEERIKFSESEYSLKNCLNIPKPNLKEELVEEIEKLIREIEASLRSIRNQNPLNPETNMKLRVHDDRGECLKIYVNKSWTFDKFYFLLLKKFGITLALSLIAGNKYLSLSNSANKTLEEIGFTNNCSILARIECRGC